MTKIQKPAVRNASFMDNLRIILGRTFRNPLVNITLVLICVMWTVPTVGLLVTSFREPQAITQSGWWQAWQPVKDDSAFNILRIRGYTPEEAQEFIAEVSTLELEQARLLLRYVPALREVAPDLVTIDPEQYQIDPEQLTVDPAQVNEVQSDDLSQLYPALQHVSMEDSDLPEGFVDLVPQLLPLAPEIISRGPSRVRIDPLLILAVDPDLVDLSSADEEVLPQVLELDTDLVRLVPALLRIDENIGDIDRELLVLLPNMLGADEALLTLDPEVQGLIEDVLALPEDQRQQVSELTGLASDIAEYPAETRALIPPFVDLEQEQFDQLPDLIGRVSEFVAIRDEINELSNQLVEAQAALESASANDEDVTDEEAQVAELEEQIEAKQAEYDALLAELEEPFQPIMNRLVTFQANDLAGVSEIRGFVADVEALPEDLQEIVLTIASFDNDQIDQVPTLIEQIPALLEQVPGLSDVENQAEIPDTLALATQVRTRLSEEQLALLPELVNLDEAVFDLLIKLYVEVNRDIFDQLEDLEGDIADEKQGEYKLLWGESIIIEDEAAGILAQRTYPSEPRIVSMEVERPEQENQDPRFDPGELYELEQGGSIEFNENGTFTFNAPEEPIRGRLTFPFTVERSPVFSLDNYDAVINNESTPMGQAFLNSLTITIPATIIPIALAAFAAYAFSWMDFPFRQVLFVTVVGLQVVPLQMSLIPLLRIYTDLGLNGEFLGIWLAHTGFGMPLAVFLLANYIRGLPRELIEAANIDGASHWQIFVQLIVPLSVPALASFAIFQFLWVWNDLLVALVFLGQGGRQPVTAVLQELVGSFGSRWELLTAGAFITMILPLLVFFALQRYFVRGLLAGSVKGG